MPNVLSSLLLHSHETGCLGFHAQLCPDGNSRFPQKTDFSGLLVNMSKWGYVQILLVEAIELIIKGISYCNSRLASYFSRIRMYLREHI